MHKYCNASILRFAIVGRVNIIFETQNSTNLRQGELFQNHCLVWVNSVNQTSIGISFPFVDVFVASYRP